MPYATAAEFGARYVTKLTDAEISSHFLPFASTRLDAMLAPSFTVPFSDNNLAAKDLTIDLSYLLILQRSKEPKDLQSLQERIEGRIIALAEGREAMMTDSGEAIFAESALGDVWSSTSTGKPIFCLEDHLSRWAGCPKSGDWT